MPSEDADLSKIPSIAWILPLLAVPAGAVAMVGAWVALGALSGSSASWLALVGALDIAALLRLTHAPPGGARSALAVLGTLAIVASSQWLLAAARVGALVGLEPLDAAGRLGPALGWQVIQLSLDRVDWILLLASLPLAWILVEPARPAAPPPP